MLNASTEYRKALLKDTKTFQQRIVVTLTDNTELIITNSKIWKGSSSFDEASSSDNVFEVGAAVIGSFSFTINNMYEEYSEYDFDKARVVPYMGLLLPNGTTEYLKKGEYIVDDTSYNGSTIRLSCLDKLSLMDRKYDTSLNYPATLAQIVNDACLKCGVTLDANSANFPHKSYTVQTRPSSESTTYREIVSYCAQIAGCYAKMNSNGYLTFGWYDQSAIATTPELRETLEDVADFVFNTYKDYSWSGLIKSAFVNADGLTPQGVVNFSGIFSHTVCMDDVVITGVRVTYDVPGENTDGEYTTGTDGYLISIERNDLIQTAAQAKQVGDWLGAELVGFRYRVASVNHLGDPTIEAGDVGFLIDRKGNVFPIIVSGTSFKPGAVQNTRSSGATPSRNSADRFSAETKNYVRLKEIIQDLDDYYQNGLDELSEAMEGMGGLYTTIQAQPTGGNVYYLHNAATLAESNIVWKMNDEAWAVSTNGGQTWNGGMTINGDVIAHILSADGVNANWINTGALNADLITTGTLRPQHGGNFINLDTGEMRLASEPTKVSTSKPKGSDFWESGAWGTDGVETVNPNRLRSIRFPDNVTSINASNDYSFAIGAWVDDSYQGYLKNNGDIAQGTANLAWVTSFNVDSYRLRYPTYEYRALLRKTTAASSAIDFDEATESVTITTVDSLGDYTENQVNNAVVTYDTSLNQQKVFNKLTNNGRMQGLYMEDGDLYINASYIGAGTLASTDSNHNFMLTLSTGEMNMKKGTINLGAVGNNYNFSVTDSGVVSIRRGSINLGAVNDDYNFKVSDNGLVTIRRGAIQLGAYTDGDTTAYRFNVTDGGVVAITRGSINLGVVESGGYNFTVSNSGVVAIQKGSIRLGAYTEGETTSYNFNVNDSGVVTIKKGSISLGASNGGYNFSVNDSGVVRIKSGSITLGSASGTSYFNADTDGKFQWKSENSSLSNTGILKATNAELTGKVIAESNGLKSVLEDGFLNFYANNSLVGRIGAASFGSFYGFDIDVPSGARSAGFMLGTGSGASELFMYHRADNAWHIFKSLTFEIGSYPSTIVSANNDGLTVNGSTLATQSWVTSQGLSGLSGSALIYLNSQGVTAMNLNKLYIPVNNGVTWSTLPSPDITIGSVRLKFQNGLLVSYST